MFFKPKVPIIYVRRHFITPPPKVLVAKREVLADELSAATNTPVVRSLSDDKAVVMQHWEGATLITSSQLYNMGPPLLHSSRMYLQKNST